MSEESSADVAKQWMEIADIDKSGTIDETEWKAFIKKLDASIEN